MHALCSNTTWLLYVCYRLVLNSKQKHISLPTCATQSLCKGAITFLRCYFCTAETQETGRGWRHDSQHWCYRQPAWPSAAATSSWCPAGWSEWRWHGRRESGVRLSSRGTGTRRMSHWPMLGSWLYSQSIAETQEVKVNGRVTYIYMLRVSERWLHGHKIQYFINLDNLSILTGYISRS